MEEGTDPTVQEKFAYKLESWRKSGQRTWLAIYFETYAYETKDALFSQLRNQGYNIRRMSYARGPSMRESHALFVTGAVATILNIWDRMPWLVKCIPIPITIFAWFANPVLWIISIFFFFLWAIFAAFLIFVMPEDDTPGPL
jgi:hypothetical protein